MIVLYQFATSPFAEKVRRALDYKRIDYTIEDVVRRDVAGGRYAAVSKTGKFPAIDHDGHAVWDSTDIIRHLDEAFPDRPLIPADPRDAAMAHVIEDWADESLYFYEMTMRLAWPHNLESGIDEFAKTLPAMPRDQIKKIIQDGVTALVRAQGVGRKPDNQVVADARRHFLALDALLEGKDWLAGPSLSIADIAVIAQVKALLYAAEARAILATTRSVKPWMDRVDHLAPAAFRSA